MLTSDGVGTYFSTLLLRLDGEGVSLRSVVQAVLRVGISGAGNSGVHMKGLESLSTNGPNRLGQVKWAERKNGFG